MKTITILFFILIPTQLFGADYSIHDPDLGYRPVGTDLPGGAIVQMDVDEEQQFLDELDAYFDADIPESGTWEANDYEYDYYVEDRENEVEEPTQDLET